MKPKTLLTLLRYFIRDAILLFAADSASLTSILALQHRYMPFRDLQGRVYDGSYKLGVFQSTVFISTLAVRSKNSSDHIVILFFARSNGASWEEYKRC